MFDKMRFHMMGRALKRHKPCNVYGIDLVGHLSGNQRVNFNAE